MNILELVKTVLLAVGTNLDKRDSLGLTGIGLLGYGCWLVYPPLGFILPGAVILFVALR